MRSQSGLSFLRRIIVFSVVVISLILGLAICPTKVFAAELITPAEWYNHISQFEFGIAYGEIDRDGNILVVEEPGHEYDGYQIEFDGDVDWFEPALYKIERLVSEGNNVVWYLNANFEDFDGYLYWNFEEGYWQVEYYNKEVEVDMVTDLLDTLAEIGAGIGDLFGRIVESVGQFFYTPGTGDTPGSFTIVGILTIAAVVVSLSMWVLRLILRLFKLRG